MAGSTYEISAPAAHTAKVLLRNFQMVEKGTILPTERNLAILVDVCTQVWRIEQAVDNLVRRVPWLNKNDLRQNLDQLREAIYAIDVMRNRMPNYGRSMPVPRDAVEAIKDHMNRPDIRERAERARDWANKPKLIAKRQDLARRLTNARTAEEQQQILQQGEQYGSNHG